MGTHANIQKLDPTADVGAHRGGDELVGVGAGGGAHDRGAAGGPGSAGAEQGGGGRGAQLRRQHRH